MVNSVPTGSIIMYATSANATAVDGAGRNGLFTSQLLNNLKAPQLSIRDIFDKTGEDVIRVSNGRQHPEISIRFFGASSVFLGSQSGASSPAVQSGVQAATPQSPGIIPAVLFGTWVNDTTSITFTSEGFSVSWPVPDGSTMGYTVSALTCITASNTSGRNPGYYYGYRITGKITNTNVPTIALNDNIDRSYFLDANQRSFWNSGSSTNIIYYKQ